MIYEGKRDPSPLFQAIASLGTMAERVKVSFYGRYLQSVIPQARKYGVEQCVEVHEPVPHKESIRLQCTSDVLLLLLWDDPGERGTYTGKLYEYLGTGRPLLVIGPQDCLASKLVRQLEAGVVETDAIKIAQHLRNWIEDIDRFGQVKDRFSTQREGLTRKKQAERLVEFISGLLATR